MLKHIFKYLIRITYSFQEQKNFLEWNEDHRHLNQRFFQVALIRIANLELQLTTGLNKSELYK